MKSNIINFSGYLSSATINLTWPLPLNWLYKFTKKGLGYASSVGLEFDIARDFGRELYNANKEEYPPEPEVSDKEKRRFGVS